MSLAVYLTSPRYRYKNTREFSSLNNSTSNRVLNLLEPIYVIVRKPVIWRISGMKFEVNSEGGDGILAVLKLR